MWPESQGEKRGVKAEGRVSEFRTVAKITLADTPQQLEALRSGAIA